MAELSKHHWNTTFISLMDLVNKLLLPEPKHAISRKVHTKRGCNYCIEPSISALSLNMSVTGYKLHVDWESAENIQLTKHEQTEY